MSTPESTEVAIVATELETQQGAGIVCVAGDITEAITQYIAVKDALDKALPDCIMVIGNRSFRKKEYWRAVATAFNLNVYCLTPNQVEKRERGEDWGFEVTYRAMAPNGRFADGDGSCYASEKRGRGQATVHNVRAHAHTRAFNRAVSNLVGFGEVSADEINPEEVRREVTDRLYAPLDYEDGREAFDCATAAVAATSGDQVPHCLDCGGPMWDNRATKKGKQPDFKCKADRDQCNGAIWLPTEEPREAYYPDKDKDEDEHDPTWESGKGEFFFHLTDIAMRQTKGWGIESKPWDYEELCFLMKSISESGRRVSRLNPEERNRLLDKVSAFTRESTEKYKAAYWDAQAEEAARIF